MNYRLLRAGLCCVVLLLSAPLEARQRTGDYFVFRAIGGISSVEGVEQDSGGRLQIRNDLDEVAGAAFVFGYDWAGKGVPLRTELEYHHRFRFDFDTRIIGGSNAGFENQLSTDAVMVNLFYDFDIGLGFKPYVGGGIGWVRNTSDVDRVPLAGTAKEERTDRKDNMGWSAMFGVMFDLSEGWRFELGYRYIDLGEVSSGPFRDGTLMTAEDYTSHDLILGILYRF